MMRSLLFVSLLALFGGALGGCTFGREVVNPHVRALDTAWIRPGVTTRAEVIARLGYPPALRGAGGVTRDSFRWTIVDTSLRRLEGGYIVSPTFERGVEYFAEDILIRFDPQDVVTLVSRTRVGEDGRPHLLQWAEKTP